MPSELSQGLEDEEAAGGAAPPPALAEGEPSTITEAQARYGTPVCLPGRDPCYDHVVFPTSGAYGMNIKQDGIIKDSDYQLLFKGRFETGDAAKAPREVAADQVLSWAGVTSVDDKFGFLHDLKGKSFTKKPVSLQSFLTFLESNQKVRVQMAMHKLEKDKVSKKYQVSPLKDISFKILPIDNTHREKPTDQNAASYLKVKDLKDHPRLVVYPRWKYSEAKNTCEAARPALYFKESMRVKAGTYLPLITPSVPGPA